MTLRAHSMACPIQNNRSFHCPWHVCRFAMQRQSRARHCLRKYYFRKYFCYGKLIAGHNRAGAILRTGSGQYGYQFQQTNSLFALEMNQVETNHLLNYLLLRGKVRCWLLILPILQPHDYRDALRVPNENPHSIRYFVTTIPQASDQ